MTDSLCREMDVLPTGEFLIADENFLGQGGISKITRDFSTGSPSVADVEPLWMVLPKGLI